MARRKKICIGDVVSFQITDEIINAFKIEIPDVFDIINNQYKKLKYKKGYCIAINLKDEWVLIESKRVDVENPTLDQIKDSKTISISWTSKYALTEREYEVIGNIPMEPKKVKRFWSVAGRDFDDFLEGKDVQIYIEEVEGDFPVNFVGKTNDVNIIKELYRHNGTNTYATIMLDYLLRYNRDENDINTLKW